MSDSNDTDNEIAMEAVAPYISSYGSVRLKNCFLAAIDDGCIPYTTLNGFLSDPEDTRIRKFMRVPNAGKKTAKEFNELVAEYCKSNEIEEVAGIVSNNSIDRDFTRVSIHDANEPEYNLEDRYSNLSLRDIDVVQRRFGINCIQEQTLEAIGEQYGITRERIRQIESKALKKLRVPHIIRLWERYIDLNFDHLLDGLFGESMLVEIPKKITGEFALAVSVVHKKVPKFLDEKAQRFEKFWVRPNIDILEVQSTRNRMLACIQEQSSLPLSISQLSKAFGVNGSVVEAAVAALEEHKVYDGWVIRGYASSRKRRIVNVLNLFHKKTVNSPASLWEIKVTYWNHFEDECSGRDLLISLQDHRGHFVNLHELGWVCLTLDISSPARNSKTKEYPKDIPDQLYQRPVKTGHGLANSVYALFEKHGPLRLSDAAELFQQEYPDYAVSSMYPMLVYYAVFFRFAPGVLGIQAHRKNLASVNQARGILLNERDLDLYLYSRDAGPPRLRYPLWDEEMEKLWADWFEKYEDFSRLGALLSVARIEKWPISQSEKERWESRKQELDTTIDSPEVPIFSERFIDTEILRTALAALSNHGFVNWMYLNQAIGWRVETTRVALVLAVLIRIGALKSTGDWNKTHLITKHGRVMLHKIFGRPVGAAVKEIKSVKAFLKESVKPSDRFGWASEYDFGQLLEQISDISGRQGGGLGKVGVEDSDIESGYEGFMGEALRQLTKD